MANETDLYAAVQAAADRYTTPMRDAILAALVALKQGVKVEEIARLLSAGRVVDTAVLPLSLMQEKLIAAVAVLRTVFGKAGQAAEATWTLKTGFDLHNPFIEQAMAQRAAGLITHLSVEAEATLRAVLVQAVADDLPWTTVAELVRPLIGLNQHQAVAVLKYREALLQDGITPLRTDTLVLKRTRQLTKVRAETIARTELIGAANAAQQTLWQMAESSGLVAPGTTLRRWITTPDDRLCPRCAEMHGQQVGLDAVFVQPSTGRQVPHPPLHPRCRCAMVRAEAAA